MVLGDPRNLGRASNVSGRSLDAFATRRNALANPMFEEIAELEGSRLSGLASPSTGQERLLQQTPRYETGQAAAEVYGYDDIQSRGPVTTIFDFLGRGQSAVTGAVTGLFGMEREGDVDERGGIGTAARRFVEGFSGGERYRFAEFTDTGRRLARGEEVGGLAKGWNTALGFVLDTVADPLTYVSFGGSVMGRMRAANAIRSSTQNAMLRGVSDEAFDSVRFMNDAMKKRVTRTDKLALDMNAKAKAIGLKDFNVSTTSSYDDLLRSAEDVFVSTNKQVNLLREVALDYAPDVAAMSYAQRSSAGLRRWAVSQFGDELGEAYFRSLPKDIQGGIRIRLPFARNADGTPIAFGIDGIGAGRLGDKYSAFRKIEDLTQSGRDVAREFFEGTLGRFSGASGAIYYDAVLAATGRRNRTRTSTWVDYQGSRLMDESRRSLRAVFDERFLREHEVTSQLYMRAKEAYKDDFSNRFKDFMYNTTELDNYKSSRNFASDAEEAAFNVANSWRTMLDEIGNEAVEVFNGDTGLAFNFLTDYVPRITARREEAGRFFTSKGTGKPGTKPQYVKQRGQWAASWEIDSDGNARVLRWMPNEDISRIRSGQLDDVYESDPTIFMSAYLADVRSTLNDQKILNLLRENNLLTSAEREVSQKIDEAEIQRRVVQLVGDEDPTKALAAKTFNVQKFVNEIEKPELNYQPGGPYLVGDALASYLQRVGIDIPTINDINNYQLVGDTYVNIIDGSGIRRNANGRYVVVDRTGKAIFSNEELTASGVQLVEGATERGTIREFDTFDGARANWDSVQSRVVANTGKVISNRENMFYNHLLLQKREEIFEQVSQIFVNPLFADVHMNQLAGLTDDKKTEYVEAWLNALKLFGLDEPELVVTREGMPAFARGLGTQPIVTEQMVPTEAFRNWIADSGYMNIGGISFDANGNLDAASQVVVKQRISQQMVNEYAPQKLMENIQRMYRVTQSPQTVGQEIYNNFYKPLYAAQKAWMTLGRGPGFVARNVLGGSWNNWINGVGREHTLKASRMVAAKTFAKREIAKKIKDVDILELEPVELANMYRDANKKYLARYYSGAELDETLEYWDVFSRNGLGGNRDTARLYGELLRGNSASNAGTPSRLPSVRVTQFDDEIQIVRDEDLSRLERLLEFAAGDNYWIREIMSPAVEISEDYLRFAAFLKGVQEVGLEAPESGIRGYAAAQWVKATQFDYADLSDFEQAIKMVVPFYSWTRNNIPLQVRVFIQQPGRVAQALRIHESLGNMFGDEETNISPSYIADRFGITFAENNPFFDMLPEWMKPQGDVTLGIAWGEPIADVNTLFRDPTYAARNGLGEFIRGGVLNWREVFGQLNPIIAAASAAQQGFVESGPRREEDSPMWARALGLSREDPTEPGSYVSNRATLDFIRTMIPVVDQAERVIPFLGGERQEGRWTTSLASNLFGLNLSTVDDWQQASEMQRRTDFIQRQMKNDFGPSWQYRNELIGRLLREGATTDFIRALNLQDMDDQQIDVNRAVHTWRFVRRIELLIENGVPEDEIIASISAFVPEGSKMESLVQTIWDYVPKPSTDFEEGVRYFGLQPVTRNDLEELGLTVRDVRNMTEEQQRRLVYIVNRNKGWTGPQN